jgi:hypothetical protein
VNFGRPVWHASIARVSRAGLIATLRWGAGVTREARRQLIHTLDGVGQEPTVLSMRGLALHMRRSLAPAEVETLDPAWLAIPARDEFSEDGEGSEIAMEL